MTKRTIGKGAAVTFHVLQLDAEGNLSAEPAATRLYAPNLRQLHPRYLTRKRFAF